MAVLVQLWELPGGRCVSALPVLLWEGSSAHSCDFVAFLSSWPWIALLLLWFLTGFPTRHRTKPTEFSLTDFAVARGVSNSNFQSRLAVWVRSEQCQKHPSDLPADSGL